MANHVISARVGFGTIVHRANVVLLTAVFRHMAGQVFLPKKASAASVALEGAVIRTTVAFLEAPELY